MGSYHIPLGPNGMATAPFLFLFVVRVGDSQAETQWLLERREIPLLEIDLAVLKADYEYIIRSFVNQILRGERVVCHRIPDPWCF